MGSVFFIAPVEVVESMYFGAPIEVSVQFELKLQLKLKL